MAQASATDPSDVDDGLDAILNGVSLFLFLCSCNQSLYSFLRIQECDLVTTAAATARRVELVDFTHPTLYMPVSFIIPTPKLSVNLLSALQPFDILVNQQHSSNAFDYEIASPIFFCIQVWVGIAVTFIVTIGSFHLFFLFLRPRPGEAATPKFPTGKIVYFTVGLLLKQCILNEKSIGSLYSY